MTNTERSERAWSAIDGYADNDDLETCIIDILTDLQHLCAQEEISYRDCSRIAANNYQEGKP